MEFRLDTPGHINMPYMSKTQKYCNGCSYKLDRVWSIIIHSCSKSAILEKCSLVDDFMYRCSVGVLFIGCQCANALQISMRVKKSNHSYDESTCDQID